ncbi:MAG: acetate--CoA ligase family protein [Deltaproteobacteria bacterium]|nr:acetate--CoA ligase family protein [Deltaproteobacteria bacterium]
MQKNINFFFNPQSIALIGASPTPGKLSNVLLQSLKKRFKGNIYPVNPKYKSIDNLKCYAAANEIKEKIDIAVLIVPSNLVLQTLNDTANAGAKGAVVISAGFKETGNSGASQEEEIKKLVNKTGMRVIGPNCMGLYDSFSGVDTFFISEDRLQRPEKGGLSIISQSGSFAVSIMDTLAMEGIGIARVVNYGNRVDVGENDLLDFFAGDENTKIVALYIEAVEDGKRFIETAKKCSSKKPVIAIKVGKFDAGAKAAKSHTGAIAGRYEIYKAAFKKAGIIEVSGYNGLLDACRVFSMQEKANGKKVFILTDGGGVGVSLTDSCIEMGLDAAPLPEEAKTELSKKLPAFCSIANPLDLTGSVTDNEYKIALEQGLKHYDIAIVAALWGPPGLTDNLVSYIKDVSEKLKKPVIICSPGGRFTQDKKRLFESKGLPVFLTPEDAVKAAVLLTDKM